MQNILTIKNLTKRIHNQVILDSISLNIQKGDVYGLVGRNGAGKTTLMKVITTLIGDTEGSVSLFGSLFSEDYNKALSRTASIIETPTCYENLSAQENLVYYCKLRGIKDKETIANTLQFVGLDTVGKKKVKHFSLGMKQRLGLAIALIANPDFLILDEPINGLDPIAIIEFRELIRRINADYNTTILISSHILSELYLVSNRFGFIDKGRLIQEVSKKELDDKCQQCIVVASDDLEKITVLLEEHGFDFKVFEDNAVRIYGDLNPADINKLILSNNLSLTSIYKEADDLENYFKALIKEASV